MESALGKEMRERGDKSQSKAKDKIIASTNCGMAPMGRDIAYAKLAALGRGAALARQRLG